MTASSEPRVWTRDELWTEGWSKRADGTIWMQCHGPWHPKVGDKLRVEMLQAGWVDFDIAEVRHPGIIASDVDWVDLIIRWPDLPQEPETAPEPKSWVWRLWNALRPD